MLPEIGLWIVLGLIIGWLAGSSMKGSGYGILGDIAVGAVGAIAGVWLVGFVVPDAHRGGIGGSVIAGAVAAVLFIAVARLLTRRSGKASSPSAPPPATGKPAD